MSAADYDIVRYAPRYKEQIAALPTTLWSTDPALNLSYFEWKYEQNPYVDEPLFYLALRGGRVVAMRGAYGAVWEAGPDRATVSVPCFADLLIEPEHRNRGLVTRIMEEALSHFEELGLEYAFSPSANWVTALASKAMGWREMGPLRAMRLAQPPPFLARLRKSAPTGQLARIRERVARIPGSRRTYRTVRGLAARARRFRPLAASRVRDGESDTAFSAFDSRVNRRRGEGGVSASREARPEAMAALVKEGGGDGRIRHVRDPAYFAWRFRNPLRRYRFLLSEDQSLNGYLVLGSSVQVSARQASILDWEGADSRARAGLLRAAIEWGDFQSLTIWSESLPAETRTLLEAEGFHLIEYGDDLRVDRPRILVRSVGKRDPRDWKLGDRPLLERASWDVRMAYSDAY